MSSHETLGLLLVRDGIITRPQLYDALRLQRQDGQLLGSCLMSLGYVSPQTLLDILARQLAIPALPPGTLAHAAEEAVQRVPAEVALRLRAVPYSWNGEMLGVAVADGRSLNHLHEVAYHARAAVGAYVALETDIDAALARFYPTAAQPAPTPTPPSPAPEMGGRPRPARAGSLTEVSSRDFGTALGVDSADDAPVLLEKPKRAVIKGAPPRVPLRGPPPPAPTAVATPESAPATVEALSRVGFYDAVERIYEEATVEAIGATIGRALLNYFSRVLILRLSDRAAQPIAAAALEVSGAAVPFDRLPAICAGLSQRSIAYGKTAEDSRAAEIATAFDIASGVTSLIAPVAAQSGVYLLVFADNAAAADLYEDLHDVELLFKEAETALGLLLESASTNGATSL